MKDLMAVESVETMTSTQLAELLGKKKHHVNESVRKMFKDKVDSGSSRIRSSIDLRGYVTDYHLPELESKMFVAKHDINYLEQITQFWIDGVKPKLPQTYKEALLELIASEEAKEQALLERDVAVATKAEINNKKTATAMNTASQKAKEVKKLVKALQRHDCKTMTELLKEVDISSRAANTKLEKSGYLFTESVNGKNRKRLTKKGKTIAKEFPGSKFVQIGILPSCEEQVLDIVNV